MDEAARQLLLARVARKERLAALCEKGKIPPEEYIDAVNELRAAAELPPLAGGSRRTEAE